ncbi:MAG: tail fiber domain-containing protein [Candidatus Omnitrophica bacterium]|nr:tail fiber domain-containing protein [Candidatus Omnitrophota bacterium]
MNACFYLALLITAFLSTNAYAGKYTITTYYPAPTGDYDTLKANTFTTTGNVGVGTATPQDLLHVYLNNAAQNGMTIENSGVGGAQMVLKNAGVTWTAAVPGASTDLRFHDGTADRVTFQDGGNVGIGTTAPAAKLAVSGGAVFSSNVGIGTTSPQALLDIQHPVTLSGAVAKFGSMSFEYKYFNLGPGGVFQLNEICLEAPCDGTKASIGFGSASFGIQPTFTLLSGAGRDLALGSAIGTVSITIASAGNVGIGTASPGAKLEVVGGNLNIPSTALTFNSLTKDGTAGIAATDFGSIFGEHDAGTEISRLVIQIEDNSEDSIVMRTANWYPTGVLHRDSLTADYDKVILVKDGGNVGIGTTAPMAKLHIVAPGSVGGPEPLRLQSNSTFLSAADKDGNNTFAINNNPCDNANGFSCQHLAFYGNTNGTDGWYSFMRSFKATKNLYLADSGGNVGIGVSAADPWPATGVNPDTSASLPFKLVVNGSVQASAFYYSSSDERLKTKITPIPDALAKVRAMNGVYFNWKKTPQDRNVGVIAQNIETVLPEVVSTDKNGFKSVQYSNLVAVLIEAVKEQDKKITELEKKLDALTQKK